MIDRVDLDFLKTNKEWKEAVIVYKQCNFKDVLSEKERSYKVKSSAKFFRPNAIGNSLVGNCLDEKDNNVRLDLYDWEIEHCYIIK